MLTLQAYIPAYVKAQKIAKGLCYYSDEKFDWNHKCKFKEPKLFTVEIGSYNEEEVLQEIRNVDSVEEVDETQE